MMAGFLYIEPDSHVRIPATLVFQQSIATRALKNTTTCLRCGVMMHTIVTTGLGAVKQIFWVDLGSSGFPEMVGPAVETPEASPWGAAQGGKNPVFL